MKHAQNRHHRRGFRIDHDVVRPHDQFPRPIHAARAAAFRVGGELFNLALDFVHQGKGGHERIVPVVDAFFTHLAAYLTTERPPECDTGLVFVVLKGPRRGMPLSAAGLDEVLAGARGRAGLRHATCHELRHTCFTRLREAGMALEAIQAQAGHANLETTRIYLHLSNDWLADQYRDAMQVLSDIYPPIEEGPRP